MSYKGKESKGKGKGKTESSPEGGKGHLLPRTRLSAEKFTGTVVAWKGKFGWLKSAEDIEHPKAGAHGGNIFAGMDDLVGVEALELGATVEFHVWEDESGLGAEEIEQTSAGDPSSPLIKGKGKGKSKSSWGAAAKGGGGAKGPQAWEAAEGGWGAKGWGAAAAKGGSKGWGAPSAAVSPVISGFKGAAKGAGKDGKGKDKGKGKKGGGKGHLLPRTRVTAEKFTGSVSAWKGKYGWITPAEEVSHEKAGNHNGGIFVSMDDCGGIALEAGQVVEFHIWEDSSGLGAEEVVVQS